MDGVGGSRIPPAPFQTRAPSSKGTPRLENGEVPEYGSRGGSGSPLPNFYLESPDAPGRLRNLSPTDTRGGITVLGWWWWGVGGTVLGTDAVGAKPHARVGRRRGHRRMRRRCRVLPATHRWPQGGDRHSGTDRPTRSQGTRPLVLTAQPRVRSGVTVPRRSPAPASRSRPTAAPVPPRAAAQREDFSPPALANPVSSLMP